MNIQVQLFQFSKDENEDGVRCTCFIMIGGEHKGSQNFVISDEALGPKWNEDDLVAAINKSEEAVRLKMTVTRMPPRPKSEP